MRSSIFCCFILLFIFSSLVLQPTVSSVSTTSNGFFTKKHIKVAFIMQKWDYMDKLIRVFVIPFYHLRFREIEKKFNVKCDICFLWDSWRGGDVQSGKLRKLNVDVAIGPGGVGAWHTPPRYRMELRRFIQRGGGFYGICGDSYLGTVGTTDIPVRYQRVLKKLFGYRHVTSPLRMVNVRSDPSIFLEEFKPVYTHNNFYVLLFIIRLYLSTCDVYIQDEELPFANSLRGETVKIMPGCAPLVEGLPFYDLFLPGFQVIGTFVDSRSPYDPTLLTGKYAIVASEYGEGRVILSPVHPEVSAGRAGVHTVFDEGLLWLAQLDEYLEQ